MFAKILVKVAILFVYSQKFLYLCGFDYEAINRYLLACNAYEEPENARLIVTERE